MKALVVLGNRLNDDGSMSDALLARLQMTLALEGGYDVVLLSGGTANLKAGISEAEKMYAWLVEKGMRAEKLIVENRSRTTKENAKFCRPLLERLSLDEVALLSSADHIDRRYLNPSKLFKRYAKVTPTELIRA